MLNWPHLKGVSIRRHIGWAVVIAFLFRALVPVGFMPGISPAGSAFGLVICTSAGVKTIIVDPAQPEQQNEHSAKDGPCAFSGLGVLSAPNSAGGWSLGQPLAPLLDDVATASLPLPYRVGPTAGPRAPPLS